MFDIKIYPHLEQQAPNRYKTKNGIELREKNSFRHRCNILINLSKFDSFRAKPEHIAVHKIQSLNALAVTNGDKKTTKGKMMAVTGKIVTYILVVDTELPIPSVETEINDYEYYPDGLLIFRWPVLFYTGDNLSTLDRHRTIDRQLRESEFIEKSFQPLGQRPKPYPFFVPKQPLDPFWSPPAKRVLAANQQRAKKSSPAENSRKRNRNNAQRDGDRTGEPVVLDQK